MGSSLAHERWLSLLVEGGGLVALPGPRMTGTTVALGWELSDLGTSPDLAVRWLGGGRVALSSYPGCGVARWLGIGRLRPCGSDGAVMAASSCGAV
ncbi:hypothetical protein E2562_037954 [Oryza meyeriana var. granulata]|uniref:Uncharacterized protein n=1 Tax=Oryza meyeriana var. granulata TaxID=110450 RepID=A0A6G1EU13_9ORYZ|nr:hypothetical protein E2562_037954 [Oryza meyeriana var. granulata]